VKLIGSIAIVNLSRRGGGTNEGAPVKGTYRYTRVYQRLPSGGWKITSFEATRVPGPKNPADSRDTNRDAPPKRRRVHRASRTILETSASNSPILTG